MAKGPGYFAVSRTIFDHPILKKGRKKFSRHEAWEWLLGQAAWKPSGQRNTHGIIHRERGQITFTRRELALAWGWTKSKVDRFLVLCAENAMIMLDTTRCGPEIGPETKPQKGYARTIITLCNYNKFNGERFAARSAAGQKSGQNESLNEPHLPGIVYENRVQPSKQSNHKDSKKATARERRVNSIKPPHRQPSFKNGVRLIWLDYGTEEWLKYADDYREVREVAIFPSIYIGGRGNWFAKDGEAVRLKRKRA